MKVLYVGRSNIEPDEFCPGSLVCMSIVERFQEQIQIQDCSILRQNQKLPAWLNGTPIFVDQTQGVPHRGSDAVRELQRLLKEESLGRRQVSNDDDDDDEPAVPAKRAPPRGAIQQAPPRMAPPAQTRQPSDRPRVPTKQAPPVVNPNGGLGPEHMGTADDDDVNDDGFDATANGQNLNAPIGDNKLTDEDLQRFMQQRNSSPASAQPPQPPAHV